MKPLYRDKSEWPQIGCFDIEATSWTDIVCLCHVDEFGNNKVFKNRADYMDWLFKAYPGQCVWSHWGGHYDMQFMIAEAYYRGWSANIMLSGSLIVIARIRDHNGREIIFCESARLMPDSLEKIGKSVGIAKLDVARDKIHEYSIETIIEYCFNDCFILLKGLQQMRLTLTSVGADFAFTLASICTRYVRRSDVLEWHRFYDTKGKKLTYSTKMLKADEFCEPAFFGGRVEVFKTGKFKNLYYYDITSSYPWSMTHDLPAYFLEFRPPPKSLESALNVCGISEATIFIPRGTMYAPILPYRFQGKLVFPEGHFRGRWANIELKAFWQRNKHNKNVTITIHGQAVFEPLAFLKPFVETFYQLRKKAIAEKNDFQTYAFKICLNSVYGKLTESLQKRSLLFGDMAREAMEKYGPAAMRHTAMPGVWGLDTVSDGPFRHVAAGCYVTASSRIRLYEGLEQCFRMNAKVYYADTDSIIVDKPVFGLRENKELGMFNLETQIAEAEIFCPKVYKITTPDNKIIYKAKGMPIKGEQCEGCKAKKPCENSPTCAERNEERWLAFTQKFQDVEERDKPIKEGIFGLLTNISKGRVEPTAFSLTRMMQNPDSKRNHVGDDSEPVYIDTRIEDANVLDFEKYRESGT